MLAGELFWDTEAADKITSENVPGKNLGESLFNPRGTEMNKELRLQHTCWSVVTDPFLFILMGLLDHPLPNSTHS